VKITAAERWRGFFLLIKYSKIDYMPVAEIFIFVLSISELNIIYPCKDQQIK